MKRHKYNFLDKKPRDAKTITYRKAFILVDKKTDKPLLVNGVLRVFYKKRDARVMASSYEDMGEYKWKIQDIHLHVTRL